MFPSNMRFLHKKRTQERNYITCDLTNMVAVMSFDGYIYFF